MPGKGEEVMSKVEEEKRLWIEREMTVERKEEDQTKEKIK